MVAVHFARLLLLGGRDPGAGRAHPEGHPADGAHHLRRRRQRRELGALLAEALPAGMQFNRHFEFRVQKTGNNSVTTSVLGHYKLQTIVSNSKHDEGLPLNVY